MARKVQIAARARAKRALKNTMKKRLKTLSSVCSRVNAIDHLAVAAAVIAAEKRSSQRASAAAALKTIVNELHSRPTGPPAPSVAQHKSILPTSDALASVDKDDMMSAVVSRVVPPLLNALTKVTFVVSIQSGILCVVCIRAPTMTSKRTCWTCWRASWLDTARIQPWLRCTSELTSLSSVIHCSCVFPGG